MSQASTSITEENAPLTGGSLLLAALVLALANFAAVLNMTIANVSIPNITGSLGAATSQGTWVITFYAIGEAITVPLTGWLAARFGPVRVFAWSMTFFGVFSAVCGFSNSLALLVAARFIQGIFGGPIMPLSQTLLMRIFPKDKAPEAIGLWAMTTLVAPVLGPILGGCLCDDYSWPWIFFINVPGALACAFVAWKMLKRYEEPLVRNPIDRIGLAFLVIWVVALQLMLDQGKDADWFASNKIVALAIISTIGLAAFIIWELHEEHPVVDLKIFRHRGFSASLLTISLTFAAFFSIMVLISIRLQNFMGYTATLAGKVTAWSGITSILVVPLVARWSHTLDRRKMVFWGAVWLGLATLWLALSTTDMGFWDVSLPFMLLGFGMPFVLGPTTDLALASVDEREMDSTAGLLNFMRTLSGAIATSISVSVWSNKITHNHAELVGLADGDQSVRTMLEGSGTPIDAVNQVIDYLITGQSVMLATNQIMAVFGIIFIIAALAIWLAPKPHPG